MRNDPIIVSVKSSVDALTNSSDGLPKIRFSASRKLEILTVFDYLSDGGYQGAVDTIMKKLAISPEELIIWRTRRAQKGWKGLQAKQAQSPRTEEAA